MKLTSHLGPGWQARMLLFVPLGVYLFVYPFGLLLLAFGLLPPGASWVGGALLGAQGCAMLAWLAINFGVARGLFAGLLVGALSWGLEAVGVTTGWPFGAYSYTPAMGAWLGPVPLGIPFAWIATVFSALFTARMLLFAAGIAGPWAHAAGAALLAAAQDFLLEPVATRIQGYWQWESGQDGFYEVPWQNFATWFVASLVLSLFALAVLEPQRGRRVYSWLPPLILLLTVLMFGLLDLARGYHAAALFALPLLAFAGVGLRLALRRRTPHRLSTGSGSAILRSLLLLTALIVSLSLSACGSGALPAGEGLPPAEAAAPVATEAPPIAVASPTSTPVPSSTPPPAAATATATEAPPAATPTSTPVLLAPDPTTTDALLLKMLDAMRSVGSYEYTATVRSHNLGQPISSSTHGFFKAPASLTWTTSSGGITTTAVLSGSDYYVSYGDDDWIRSSRAEGAREAQLPWTLAAYAEDVTLVKEGADHTGEWYQLSFDVPAVRLLIGGREWQRANADIWILKESYYVGAFRLFAADERYDTTQRFFLFNFDEPVRIELP